MPESSNESNYQAQVIAQTRAFEDANALQFLLTNTRGQHLSLHIDQNNQELTIWPLKTCTSLGEPLWKIIKINHTLKCR